MLEVKIFSDGSCLKNPGGPGGYGVIVRYLRKERLYEKRMSSAYKDTTNNRMELTAVIKGLELIPENHANITIYSDSKYVVDAFQKGWIKKWETLNWDRGQNGGPVKNVDLWQELLDKTKSNTVSFVWLKGHDGHEENEACDKLAVNAAKTQKDFYLEGYVKETGNMKEDNTNPIIKYTSEEGENFSPNEILIRKETFVIIPVGSYDREKKTGLCRVLLSYENYQKVYSINLCDCKSVNEVMLRGIIDTVAKIKYHNKSVVIITALSLGFNAPTKCVNSGYIRKLYKDVCLMNNTLEVFEIKKRTKELKRIVCQYESE